MNDSSVSIAFRRSGPPARPGTDLTCKPSMRSPLPFGVPAPRLGTSYPLSRAPGQSPLPFGVPAPRLQIEYRKSTSLEFDESPLPFGVPAPRLLIEHLVGQFAPDASPLPFGVPAPRLHNRLFHTQGCYIPSPLPFGVPAPRLVLAGTLVLLGIQSGLHCLSAFRPPGSPRRR